MRFYHIILANIFRKNRSRNILTILVVALAALLICILSGIMAAFSNAADIADSTRLLCWNRLGPVLRLPATYQDKILTVPGVKDVMRAQWFGGTYKDSKNYFAKYAMDVDKVLDIYPEFKVTQEEEKAFRAERKAVMIGIATAKKYQINLNDKINIEGDLFSGNWEFVVRAIYRGTNLADDETMMILHWDYFNDELEKNNPQAANKVNIFFIKLHPGVDASKVSGDIDKLFENSTAQTKTQSEEIAMAQEANLIGNINVLLTTIGIAVFFAMSMVAMNSMMMSALERTREIGILKSIGYSGYLSALLTISESVFICLLGSLLGVIFSVIVGSFVKPMLSSLAPAFHISMQTQLIAIGISVLMGIFSGLVPSIRAGRLNLIYALRSI